MTDIINQKDFDDFKIYARLMLDDLANAKVQPYRNNAHMQEIAVAWAPDENQDFGDHPKSITHSSGHRTLAPSTQAARFLKRS